MSFSLPDGTQIWTLENRILQHAYEFGAMNRMTRAVDGMGNVAEYAYNGLGHRTGMRQGVIGCSISQGLSGHRTEEALDFGADNFIPQTPEVWSKETAYILDFTKNYHNLLQKEERGNVQSYIWDSEVLFMEENGENYSYLNDMQGSAMRLFNHGGEDVISYRYDEFGTDLSGNQGQLQPFGYTGYQRDTVAGTYYAQAREYDAGSGRFTGEDVIKGSAAYPKTLNAYGYCWENPVNYVDWDGEETQATIDGRAAHKALQDYFLDECAKSGREGHKEYTIQGCQYNGEFYKNNTGEGRADIVLMNGNKVEVYEIKPFLGIEKGEEQLNAYIQGINRTTSYKGVKGTTFNPNGLVLDYPGNPKKEIVYYTNYDIRKGIIRYHVRNKKKKERPKLSVWGKKYNSNSENKKYESKEEIEEQDEDIAAIVGLIAIVIFGVANDAVGFVGDDVAVASACITLVAILGNKIDKLFKNKEECEG